MIWALFDSNLFTQIILSVLSQKIGQQIIVGCTHVGWSTRTGRSVWRRFRALPRALEDGGTVLGFDINAADWAAFVEDEPLIDARHVEQVHTRQAANVLFDFEF